MEKKKETTTTTSSLSAPSEKKKTVLDKARDIIECKDEDKRKNLIKSLLGDEDPLTVASKTNAPELVLSAVGYDATRERKEIDAITLRV